MSSRTRPLAHAARAFVAGLSSHPRCILGLIVGALTGCSTDLGGALRQSPTNGPASVTGASGTPQPVVSNPPTPASEPVPAVSFTSAPVFCCDPRSIIFEANTDTSKIPAGTQFHWEFGDGRTDDGQRVEHTYAWPGDYTVVLKADFRDGSVRSTDGKLSLPGDPAPLSPDDNPSNNPPPTVPVLNVEADAGDDRVAQPGTWVVLDGSASHGTGSRPLAFMWRQVGGHAVSLVNPTHSAATFLTPSNLQAPINLDFELTVVQNGISNTDQVQIAVPCTKCESNPGTDNSGNTRNDDAIAQVLSGQLTTANASWWGFDTSDATYAIQSAINSGAKTVVVPDMGQDWVVRPLFLVSNQEVILEPNVVLAAKPGAFHNAGDCLLTGDSIKNAILRGYGATLRMRKADYMTADYALSEYRHALNLKGVLEVQVLGLTFENSGGDGIFIGVSDGPRGLWCRNLTIRDCTCNDNFRQGMSVTSADNLTVDHCSFNGTIGMPAGVDVEPGDWTDHLINVEITNCTATGNAGSGFMVNLAKLTPMSQPVSVHFSGCTVQNSRQPGLRALLSTTGPSGGFVEFENCTCENTQYAGLMCDWNLDSQIALRFVNCLWNKVARYSDSDLPIELELNGGKTSAASGGITFANCTVLDDRDRDAVDVTGGSPGDSFPSVSGNISVVNPLITVPISTNPWPLPNLTVQLQHP
ncbi:MAG: right-handed parallel beta-helix repeat-containing protein [Planctomycetes bacterium]|nr:right-handed parallel beta-helix repeat-containing protein [Planctomycetota bacterium]MBI3834812.1 right-handed parallel beta-helix repeat-containing protein [Planctomycetota bacterium]